MEDLKLREVDYSQFTGYLKCSRTFNVINLEADQLRPYPRLSLETDAEYVVGLGMNDEVVCRTNQ
ncbi:hypothetical protein [uncultured Nitrosomonas sp.]|uniref:hypothetical protein n=1 Tax=uncultured Nitrosomonas sp. TaxID=156424 RepID=UPI0025FF2484|nr:hypothetical protein [uncultured Nitrosomonas sp.]